MCSKIFIEYVPTKKKERKDVKRQKETKRKKIKKETDRKKRKN